MARKRKFKKKRSNKKIIGKVQRDLQFKRQTQKRLLHLPRTTKRILRRMERPETQIYNDMRLWLPRKLKKRLLNVRRQRDAGLYLRKKTQRGRNYRLTPRFGFRDPKQLQVCKSRYARRAALFALRRVGKGIGIKTPKKLNIWSKISCKR